MKRTFQMSLENKRPIHPKLIYNEVYNKLRVMVLKTCWVHPQYTQPCDLRALIKAIYYKHNSYIRTILKNILLMVFTYFQEPHRKNIGRDTRCPDVLTQ
jgi:hypothetical protein